MLAIKLDVQPHEGNSIASIVLPQLQCQPYHQTGVLAWQRLVVEYSVRRPGQGSLIRGPYTGLGALSLRSYLFSFWCEQGALQ